MDFLQQCADEADRIACHYYKKRSLNIITKEDNSPVTQADTEIEQTIRKLSQEFNPGIEIMGEEFGSCPKDAKLKLIIDPIDGTRNFVRGIPFFATLLAIEQENKVTHGLVSSSQTAERWWAERGNGCFYNGHSISVSQVDDLSKAQAFHGSLYGSEAQNLTPKVLKLLSITDRQRGFGDYYQHMLVCMGCGEVALDFGLKPWDIAALIPVVEEAGGMITNLDGSLSIYKGDIITSNTLLHNITCMILQ
ncbi:MAG: hypothetical protein GY730_03760 [bacterium]|nr:hypothetical protein [bacterium]